MEKYATLLLQELPDDILLVTLNRPEVANAFNTQAALDLHAVFARIGSGAQHRCVVLTGAGEKAFCAGGDLKERDSLDEEQWRAQHEIFERMFRAVRDCPVPVIAAVNGAAYAGGLELVLLCDFAYASKSAKFALTEVALGIMPGGGGTQTLPRAIGERGVFLRRRQCDSRSGDIGAIACAGGMCARCGRRRIDCARAARLRVGRD